MKLSALRYPRLQHFFRSGVSLGLAIGIAMLTALPSAPSQAQGLVIITCTGTENSQYLPGITYSPQDVTFTESETDACVDTADPTLTGGSKTSSATEDGMSCTGIASVEPYWATYHWNNGKTSMIYVTQMEVIKLVNGETEVELTGDVEAGVGAGEYFTETATTGNLDLGACSSSQGLRSNAGVATITITP
ncbi:MAG: hypothetical protein ACTHNE_05750 [Dyella sp.]|uniref:hypothetical protein n=1 Tax=Dyella sp. TaxID=1869338 RepID=UPI003F81541A